MTTREKLYTVPEAAAEWGLHPGTVRRQIANERIKATKLGRDLVIAQSEIDRYRRDRLGKVGRYARPPRKPRPRKRGSPAPVA